MFLRSLKQIQALIFELLLIPAREDLATRSGSDIYQAEDSDHAELLYRQATESWHRFEQGGPREDLDESITFHREVLVLRPVGHPERSRSLNNLVWDVTTRFGQNGQREDLDECIILNREVLALRPVGHPNRSDSLCNLALDVMTRFEQDGQREDLDECITLHREALALRPAGHPDHSISLYYLATALGTRFEQDRQREDLDECITFNREVLALFPVGHSNHYDSLYNLALEVMTRFQQDGQREDLDECIILNREVLALRPVGHPDRSIILDNLALAIKTRFEQDRQREDLDEYTTFYREALALRPVGHLHRSMSLNNLAVAVMVRFEQDRQREDLNECITFFREALALHPTGNPNRSNSLINLAIAIKFRFEQDGQREDLDECITINREALTLLPIGHPGRSMTLDNLALAIKSRFEQDRQREDLDECITFYQEALALCPIGHPERFMSLNNLATAVMIRFKQDRQREDLDECIAFHQEALALCPVGHPDSSISLYNLAAAVMIRFEQDGQREDLDECIKFHREALALHPVGHLHRSASLNNLAAAVMVRFEQSGQREDLDEPITFHQEALALRPVGHLHRSMSLNNLVVAVMARFEQDRQREDLDECIAFNREALALIPVGHPNYFKCLTNLAAILETRFEQYGQREDLDESIKFSREALTFHSVGHPDRSGSLNNLAGAVMTRFEQGGQREDLDECITLTRETLDFLYFLPAGHSKRSIILNNLAHAVMARFRQDHRLEDLEESMELRASATLDPFSSLLARLEVAISWAYDARSHYHHTTFEAYEVALSLLQRALTISPTLQRQHDLLIGKDSYPPLATDAASYAIKKGNIPKAIEMLEQGRGILWSQMRGFRTPLDRVSEINKPLADRFRDTSNQLEALSTMSKPQFSTLNDGSRSAIVPPGGPQFDEILLRKRRLWEEQENMIQEIQKLPGCSDFLRPTPFETLRQAANEGPVTIMNHSRYSSDCLIILRESEPIRIPLSDSFCKEATKQVQQLIDARRLVGSVEYDNVLSLAMEWLWENAIRHVVVKLDELGIKKQSRIWLCPTSVLTFLPIHAAGPYFYDDGFIGYLLDDYVCSYTSTLKALIDARANIEQALGGNAQKPSLLVIGQPGQGDASLPNVPVEVNVLRSRATVCLENEQTTKDMVLQGLHNSNWMHFACHGHLNLEDPFNSSFELFDNRRLTLLNIVENKLPNAELAFLSACNSAAPSLGGAFDEVLHLAAAMQFCGFRSVIGTMWAMNDADGPFVVEQFYKRVFAKKGAPEIGFRRSARALQKSVLKLRETTDDLDQKAVGLERWVNFIHIGA